MSEEKKVNVDYETNKDELNVENKIEMLAKKLTVVYDSDFEKIKKDVQQVAENLPLTEPEFTCEVCGRLYPDYKFAPVGEMPVVPVRGTTFYPGAIVHFEASREETKEAVQLAMKKGQLVFAVTQIYPMDLDPKPSIFYSIGTILKIVQVINATQDKSMRVIAEGIKSFLRSIRRTYMKKSDIQKIRRNLRILLRHTWHRIS